MCLFEIDFIWLILSPVASIFPKQRNTWLSSSGLKKTPPFCACTKLSSSTCLLSDLLSRLCYLAIVNSTTVSTGYASVSVMCSLWSIVNKYLGVAYPSCLPVPHPYIKSEQKRVEVKRYREGGWRVHGTWWHHNKIFQSELRGASSLGTGSDDIKCRFEGQGSTERLSLLTHCAWGWRPRTRGPAAAHVPRRGGSVACSPRCTSSGSHQTRRTGWRSSRLTSSVNDVWRRRH